MPNSTVSSKITNLEKRLGVDLIHRTTRKLRLTQAGEAFFFHATKHVEGLSLAESEVSSKQSAPQGTLRVTAPVLIASSLLPDVISRYSEKYPQVKFELIASDTTLDLLGHNIDIAIRLGKLKDSTLKTKKIGGGHFALYASNAYLKKNPKILHPKDLLEHLCLQFTPLGKERWEFYHKSRGRVTVAMNQQILLNELNTVKEMAILGKGVALLPTFLCEEKSGTPKLLRILPEWRSAERDMSFVYPAHKYMPPKLTSFVDLAYEVIQKKL